VVANSPEFCQSVLADPRQTPEDVEFEALLYVAPEAFTMKTGQDGDAVREQASESYETFSNTSGWK
jgi:hypothetical protein